MKHRLTEQVSHAILTTPNASDYEELVARNAIKAVREYIVYRQLTTTDILEALKDAS